MKALFVGSSALSWCCTVKSRRPLPAATRKGGFKNATFAGNLNIVICNDGMIYLSKEPLKESTTPVQAPSTVAFRPNLP